jgi:hypothetical protein
MKKKAFRLLTTCKGFGNFIERSGEKAGVRARRREVVGFAVRGSVTGNEGRGERIRFFTGAAER